MSDLVVKAASSYNATASREGWASLCDPKLSFRHPALARLLSLWCEKASPGGVPMRADFSPRVLKDFLPDIAVYQRVAGGDAGTRFRVRVMGNSFSETMGNLNGRFVDEAVPKEFLPRWYAALNAALEARAPLRFLSRSDTTGKSYLVGEYLEAPLLGDSGELDMILGASHFSARLTWQQALAAEYAPV